MNRPCVGVRVELHDGQHVPDNCYRSMTRPCRCAPRGPTSSNCRAPAIAAVTQLPGWRTVVDDDFQDGGKAWKLVGKPNIDARPAASR